MINAMITISTTTVLPLPEDEVYTYYIPLLMPSYYGNIAQGGLQAVPGGYYLVQHTFVVHVLYV